MWPGGKVCCWFFPLFSEVFSLGPPVFPFPQKRVFALNHSNDDECDLHEKYSTHFHLNGCAPGLDLKSRQTATRKWTNQCDRIEGRIEYYYVTSKFLRLVIMIISFISLCWCLFVRQPGANHAPGASVTQVNYSVHKLSTFLRILADPSMQIF